jgi:hypothetical protein
VVFEALKEHLSKLDQGGKTVFADRDKGIVAAYEQVFKEAVLFNCSFHRKQNVAKNCDTLTVNQYKKCLNAKTMKALKKRKAKSKSLLKAKHMKYLDELPDHCQYKVARVHFDKRKKAKIYGHSTQQMVEGMNHQNKAARSVNICRALYILVDLEAERYRKNRELAYSTTDGITPYATRKLRELEQDVDVTSLTVHSIEDSNKSTGIVSDGRSAYKVNTKELSCECGEVEISQMPCKHLLAFSQDSRVNIPLDALVPEVWHTSKWKTQYRNDLDFKMPSKSEIFGKVDEDPLQFALARRNPKGRPKKVKRKRAKIEISIENHRKKQKA